MNERSVVVSKGGLMLVLLRSHPTCLRCSLTIVDDVAHCLFFCEQPTIVEASLRFDPSSCGTLSGCAVFSEGSL